MRKLAEAIVGPESTVELVLGGRFWSRALLFFIVARQESGPPEPRPSYIPPLNGLKPRPSVIQAPRNQHPTSSRFLLSNLMVLFSCPRSSIPLSQKARSEARMIAPQTKFISETSDSQAKSVPRSSIIGMNSFCISSFPSYRVISFRLFFHASKRSSNFSRFGLSRSSSWASAQVLSLVFNEWSHEKGVVLDIGWSSITCGTQPPTFETSVHLDIEERQRFGNKGRQRAVRI
jgi:hypothetical protein